MNEDEVRGYDGPVAKGETPYEGVEGAEGGTERPLTLSVVNIDQEDHLEHIPDSSVKEEDRSTRLVQKIVRYAR